MNDPLISCIGVSRALGTRRRRVRALHSITLDVSAGERVAVVGRSGSGKSTLLGVLAALDRPQEGRLLVGGQEVWALPERARRAVRRRFGWVPQDALSSFDPRYTAGEVVAEALPGGAAVGRAGRMGRAGELLELVGLDPAMASRRPVTLSGGECRRVAFARALAVEPEVLLADEVTSGLDVLAQERILDLMAMAGQHRTTVFVTHDLRVARRLADRVVALEGGELVDDVPVGALAEAGPALRRLVEATPGA